MEKTDKVKAPYHFIYNGIEYDATDYAEKHPGGLDFIENMKAQRKDFTEYFNCLHSEEAEKVLKSFPVISKNSPSSTSQEYFKMLEKIKHLYKPRWQIQIFLMTFISLTFLTACFTDVWWISIFGFGFTQMAVAWMGHSMTHSRCKTLYKLGCIFPALTGAFSSHWWCPKHNMHHIFTNSELYDDDIKHDYKRYLFPFLFLKWRYDSLLTAITEHHYLDLFFFMINYALILSRPQNLIYFVIGELISGFYTAFVLIGNHERQKRWTAPINQSFFDHQIVGSRNYEKNGWFWLIMMGGMQYQTEHHFFPQIPFYNLPAAVPIIRAELAKLNKSIVYGPVL